MIRALKKYLFLVSTALLALHTAQAQTGNKYIRKGNDLYKKQQYADAEANYKKALELNGKSVEGNYNLGNSMYSQKRFDAARKEYDSSMKLTSSKDVKADASYNIGNTYMEAKNWEESIRSYKNALKLDPKDEEARYNLAYAQAMLKHQQNQQNQQNKDNKDKKDQKQDQKQDKDKQQQPNDQDKDKKDQDKKDQQDQRPQPQPSKMDKQQAERMLEALSQQEKNLQDKMKKVKGQPVQTEKDW